MGDIILEFFEVVLVELDFEMHPIFGMVFSESYYLRVPFIHYFVKVLFIILGPFANRKLFDVDYPLSTVIELNDPLDFIPGSLN